MRTFAGIPSEFHDYERASAVLIPVPYDGTSTWRKGADRGPEAFLAAAENMELYDIQTDSEPYRAGIHLAEAPRGMTDPAAMVAAVESAVGRHLGAGKLVTLFGGEHSISIGALRAMRGAFGDISVLQIDAHADLRSSYEGTPFNHACAVYESSRHSNLVQVGIRSMDVSEKDHMDPDKVFWAHELPGMDDWISRVVAKLHGPVYITLDLDAFDPGIMPATGTPEPGGLAWWDVDALVRRVAEHHRILGFDVVELCPHPAHHGADFLAAKVYYKMLAYALQRREHAR